MLNFQKYVLESGKASEATHYYFPTHQYLKVPPTDKCNFWMMYCERVAEGSPCFVGEVSLSREYLPFGVDVQLSYDVTSIPQRFEDVRKIAKEIDEYMSFLITCIQETLGIYFEPLNGRPEYNGVYLRNLDNMLVWKETRVQFHGKLVFPCAKIKKSILPKILDYVLHHIRSKNAGPGATNLLVTKPLTGLDTLFKVIDGETVEMYGCGLSGERNLSQSTDSNEFLKIVNIYQEYGRVIQLEEAFAPFGHKDVIEQNLPQSVTTGKSLAFWTPLFLSIDYFPQILTLKVDNRQMETVTNQHPKMSDIMKAGDSFDRLGKLRNLLSLMSTERAEQEWSWTDIGAAIYSVDNSKDGLSIWKWFTAESDFKTDEDCETKWAEFAVDNGITIATLEYFASKDNPQRYAMIQKDEIDQAMRVAYTEQTHVAVAKAFLTCFRHELVCSNYADSTWYFYRGHSWLRSNGNHIVLHYLTEKFTVILDQIRAELASSVLQQGSQKADLESKLTLIGQLKMQLGKAGFIENVAKVAKIYYYNPNFVKFRDLNEFYTGCPNGVIDVRGHKAIFRAGKPEDFITKCACYYPEYYTIDTPLVKEVLKYLHKVYRNQNVRGFVWRFFSSCLRGRNVNKIFPIFVGEGNNSKSMVFALVQLAFGTYLVHLPTSLITGKETAANNATPALIYAVGAKIAIMEEPNVDEVAKTGTIKKMTGNVDKQFMRDCFQKGVDIVDTPVTYKVVVIANQPLKIDDCQMAIWKRTTLVEHTTIWVPTEEAPLTEEQQFISGLFPDDENFSLKLPSFAPAFLWLLVHFYEDYVKEGMTKPKEVQASTEQFRIGSNFYMSFVQDRIRQVLTLEGLPDTNAFINLNETYTAFRNWWKSEQNTQKPADKTTFRKNMQIILKTNLDANDKWYGLKLEVPQVSAGGLGSVFGF